MSEAKTTTDETMETAPAPSEATSPPAWYMTLGSWYTAPMTAATTQGSKSRG